MTDAPAPTPKRFNYRLGTWLTFGRTPRPIDMVPETLSFRRGIVKAIIEWGPLTGVIGIAIVELVPVFESILRDTLIFPLPYFVRAIALVMLLEEYRRFCWSAQRLHDLGRSAWPWIIRRLPLWATAITAVLLNEFVFFSGLNSEPPTLSVLGGILAIIIFIVLPLPLFMGYLWLSSHVFKPFNRYLETTPGDPGPNRFGQPPI